MDLDGDKITLDRRVPTRWNSDLACLDAHVYFKNPVQQLTAAAINKLQNYRLTDKQWSLADDLVEVLVVRCCFEFLTSMLTSSIDI